MYQTLRIQYIVMMNTVKALWHLYWNIYWRNLEGIVLYVDFSRYWREQYHLLQD